jgi:molybdenum cofactor cytidylyltransferase
MKLGVIILGAGASSRMGRPKLLLPWGDTTVIGHLLWQWQSLQVAQLTVVCAPANGALGNELDRLGFPRDQRIANPQPERGMFSSIQCAARWTGWRKDLTEWAICLGDQPHVRIETLARLLEFAAAHATSVCQPARNGRGRHPVILPANVFSHLNDSNSASLKEFFAAGRFSVKRCEIDDAGLDLDLDEPADYERALALVNEK